MKPTTNRLTSLLFTASGSTTYVPTAAGHQLFRITQLRSVFYRRNRLTTQLQFTNKGVLIGQSFYLVKQLPKNQHVSLLEILPNKGIQYIRAPGSKAKILKMDTRVSTAVIKLPSGVRKVFSIYSLASLGQVLLAEKKLYKNNKAGHGNNLGYKPRVRGVAMNPVDHPHGGRAKAIKYQRTP